MSDSDPKVHEERRPYRVQRRIVSVAEAVRLLPGRDATVREWLLAEGLILSLPWGGTGVDMDAVYSRIQVLADHPAHPARASGSSFGHAGEISQPRSPAVHKQASATKAALPQRLKRRHLE